MSNCIGYNTEITCRTFVVLGVVDDNAVELFVADFLNLDTYIHMPAQQLRLAREWF